MAKGRKLWHFLVKTLAAIIPFVSPMIKKRLTALVRDLAVEAAKTDNPNDDILVEALADILDIELDD